MLTVSNVITLLRLALLPFILYLTYSQQTGAVLLAWTLFSVAAVSDWLDGYVARRWSCISRMGTLLDPVVDKVVVLSVLFVLADLGLLPLWLVLLNMAREFLVTTARHAYSTPTHAVGANWMGKTKFVLQTAVIQFAYALLALESAGRGLPWGRGLLFGLALAMTLISCGFLINFVRRHGLQPDATGPEPGRH